MERCEDYCELQANYGCCFDCELYEDCYMPEKCILIEKTECELCQE